MFFTQKTVFVSFFFKLLGLAVLLGVGATFVLHFSKLNPSWILYGTLMLFFMVSFLTFWMTFQSPLRKITREMKAMLTGKSYRRILTSKTDELGVLAHFFNEVTQNLESISGNVKTHKRILKELDSAQEIQQLLIPKKAPTIPNLEITAKTRPASEIGGDTFDFFNKNGRNIFYIGDSTGHGIPAGIVMIMVDVLLETFIEQESDIRSMVFQLNRYLKPHLKPSMFMTMILMEWLPADRHLKWVGAGHEHVIHVKTCKSEIVAVKAGGIAVGMLSDNTLFIQEHEIALEENDFVVLYSDGIIEAKNKAGDVYGLPRLLDFLKGHTTENSTTEEIFEKIAIDVGQFMQNEPQLDDMTLLVMKHAHKGHLEESSTEWKD